MIVNKEQMLKIQKEMEKNENRKLNKKELELLELGKELEAKEQ